MLTSRRSRGLGARGYEHRASYLIYAGAALLLLIPISLAVDGNEVSDLEQSLFEVINGLPGFLYWPAWPFMQLGNLLIVPTVALGAALFRRFRLSAAILAAGVLKLLLEDVVKSWVFRERPGSVLTDVTLRGGDTSAAGQAFVSGHVVLVFAIAILLHPYLDRGWRIATWTLAVAVGVLRVYVGAHLPLDIVGGALLGVAIGSTLNMVVGVPVHKRN
jgi:undecaprenyl-diphosphatase